MALTRDYREEGRVGNGELFNGHQVLALHDENILHDNVNILNTTNLHS